MPVNQVDFAGSRIRYELRKKTNFFDEFKEIQLRLSLDDPYELIMKSKFATVIYKVTRSYILLMNIRVSPKYRKQGIATKIVEIILGVNECCSDQKLRVFHAYNKRFWAKFKDQVEFVED